MYLSFWSTKMVYTKRIQNSGVGWGGGGAGREGVEVLVIASKTLHLSSLQTACFCLYVTQLLKLFLNVPVSVLNC